MGAAPPWGQSLLRSCLAAHSFPPPPPRRAVRPRNEGDTLASDAETSGLSAVHRHFGTSEAQSVRNVGGAMLAKPHQSGGWGREGVRSEARAQQRLAPGGRSPHNPDEL